MRDNGIDIVVTSPTGQMQVAVEVKLARETLTLENGTNQLRAYMKAAGVPVGLVVTPASIRILRETYAGDPSIQVVGTFPTDLAQTLVRSEDPLEFEDHVQEWLESFQVRDDGALEPLLSALQVVVLPALADGTVRAAGPRNRSTVH